ncbi:PhoH family protein [Micromonospora sp. KC723]|uniref:PhoH family protein n=1 Tax=Micromonospora sp. KC723 TaxID=2530381 RepID=UPI0010454B7D|nr:PhoH family protein [Micromonospora sp. KC723]TDB75120.1 hypothetical protein E1165_12375 [Micromonospora sp. KC723]
MTYKPSDEQPAVIDSTAPVTVVLAGAGTGKTSTAAAAAGVFLQRADAQRAISRREAVVTGRRTRLPAQAECCSCRSPAPPWRR